MLTDKKENINIKYLDKQDFQSMQDLYELEITSLGLCSEPDCYVIEGLSFTKKLSITGNYLGEIIIRNCYFFKGITIHTNGLITLEDSKFSNYVSLVLCSKNLIIKNILLNNNRRFYGIELYIAVSEQLKVINSVLGSEHHLLCLYVNKDLILNNAMIVGEEISCYTNSIVCDDYSSIFASTKTSINAEELTNVRITSPTVIYNDELLFSDTNEEIDYHFKDKYNFKMRKRRLN